MDKSVEKIVAYYRVSTKKQGSSGLGLEAQQHAVQELARREGATIVAEFTEVESGKRSDRVEIARAISRARAQRSTLVIANISRLARNVAFTATLRESGVRFICCDNPAADDFTINILAAVAEKEAKDISSRTKAALAAAKRRGVKLGSDNAKHKRRVPADWRERGTVKGLPRARRKAAAKARQQRENHYREDLLDTMREWRKSGDSFRKIADKLNQRGEVTVRLKPFAAMTVKLLLD